MKKTVLFPLVALIAAEVVFTAFFLTAKPGPDCFAPRLSTGADICDYRAFIKYCLIEEQPYRPRIIEAHDACYPPIAYCLVGFFPATSTGRNAYVSALVAGLLAGFLVFLFQRSRRGALACLGATLVTVPFVSGPLRGNPSAWAAGALFVHLAWFDAASRWKRVVAAVALGFAASLKITPVVYGLLYLRGKLLDPRAWPRREIILSALAFLLFFAIPFLFFGGPGEVGAWFQNALGNSRYYSREATVGILPFVALFASPVPPWALELTVHLTHGLAALLCLAACFQRQFHSALTLLGCAMMLLCHHDYGLVYLLPAFACWVSESCSSSEVGWSGTAVLIVESALWLLCLEPALCVISFRMLDVNEMICSGACMALAIITVVSNARRAHA